MCWTARLVALIARVYFVFLVVYSSYHCPGSPDVPRYHLCKKHQAQELCLTKSDKSCSRDSEYEESEAKHGPEQLGQIKKKRPKTTGRTWTTPQPNLPGTEWFIFTFAADSAPPGSGEVLALKVLGDFKPLCSPSENLLSSSWLLVPLSSCEVWQNQPTGDLPAPAEVREGSLCSWWDLP